MSDEIDMINYSEMGLKEGIFGSAWLGGIMLATL